MSNTHWRTIMNTRFLSGDELAENGEVVTIKEWKEEMFFSPKTKTNENHITLLFSNIDKPMILTNRKAKQISKVLDTPFMENWIGKDVTLYPVTEKHFGEFFKVINIKTAEKKELPELLPDTDNWEKAKNALKENKTSIEAIRKHYKLSEVNRLKLENNEEKK